MTKSIDTLVIVVVSKNNNGQKTTPVEYCPRTSPRWMPHRNFKTFHQTLPRTFPNPVGTFLIVIDGNDINDDDDNDDHM